MTTMPGLLKHCQNQAEIAENGLRKELGRKRPVDRWVEQARCRAERWRGWSNELADLINRATPNKPGNARLDDEQYSTDEVEKYETR